MTPDFLNDLALVASGQGGPDNVTATCLELSDDGQTHILRVARNGGGHGDFLAGMKDIITAAAIEKILLRCKSRVKEQAFRLNNRFQFVYGHHHNHYIHPGIQAGSYVDESSQDIECLGQYCHETHESYMCLCEERVRQLKRATAEVIHPSTIGELKGLVDLSRLAYSVRRSSSFKHFLQANLNRRPEPGISLPTMLKIIERLGKISKIYRAALTINDFVAKTKELGRKIVIEAIPATRIPIPELADRTATQLRERAGLRFRRGNSDKVERMLKRWPLYRQHAEIQLIIFYEEHPHIHVYSNHIGCNKYACYLCFNFIKYHAVFQVDGGHQSLYSLWTVKDTISFSTRERAEAFQSALKRVSLDVEQKFQQLKATRWSRFGFATATESPTNLSRISLFPALSHSQKTLKEMSISAAVSQVQLASIREAPLEDLAEVEGHRKQTAVEQPNYDTTQPEICSSSPLATVRAPSFTPTSKVLHSSSLNARISSPNDSNSFSDIFQTSGSPLDITGVSSDVQSIASKNLVVEQRRETRITQRNIPPSATSRVVSPQASGAYSLDELEVPNSEEGSPAGVVRHHEHRRRYRRFRVDELRCANIKIHPVNLENIVVGGGERFAGYDIKHLKYRREMWATLRRHFRLGERISFEVSGFEGTSVNGGKSKDVYQGLSYSSKNYCILK
ncbi:MAG: hypothetical protein Q9191_002600 [Dirinaria sp. TL-2023a]